MANTRHSTVAHPSNFGPDADASPEEFFHFLQQLIDTELNHPRIPIKEKDTWITVISSLSDHFLSSFPSNGLVEWHNMEEKIKLVKVTLEVIERVIQRVDGIFCGPQGVVRKVFLRLLNLCTVLDLWVEVQVMPSDSIPTPLSLRTLARSVGVDVLRSLGGSQAASVPTPERSSHVATWRTMRQLFEECLAIIHDLISAHIPLDPPLIITPFKHPRVREARSEEDLVPAAPEELVKLILERPSQLPLFLNLVIEILLSVFQNPILSQWLLADPGRELVETCRDVFYHYVSPSSPLGYPSRTVALLRFIELSQSHFTIFKTSGTHFDPAYSLLRHRLMVGSKPGWDELDAGLNRLLKAAAPETAFALPEITDFVGFIRAQSSAQPLQAAAVQYTKLSIQNMSVEHLRSQAKTILALDSGSQETSIMDAINARLAEQVTTRFAESVGWKVEVYTLVERIISPSQLCWMNDDGMDDVEYFRRALEDIHTRFENAPLMDETFDARINLNGDLQAFFTKLLDRFPFLPVDLQILRYVWPLFALLLGGRKDQVSVDVRRGLFTTLAKVAMFHHLENELQCAENISSMVLSGMQDSDRTVRLTAGRCFGQLVEVYAQQSRDDWRRTERLFDSIYPMMEEAKTTVKESILVTIGNLGKTGNSHVLGLVLCFLVAQLGRPNPVLKGSACMQILNTAREQKKPSPYPLLQPYVEKIAPFLVSRIHSVPGLLVEYCRLVGMNPADFINITLPKTLPSLVGNRDRRALETIAKHLKTKLSYLLLKNSHEILAHVFLLSTASETNTALAFVVQILSEEQREASIDLHSVVKSCVVPLLAEIVITMGNENTEIAEMAVPALRKVEKALAKEPVAQDLGIFLKTYMLGLISLINDMLQDVQGKKNLLSKKRILRSLGALVELIGPPVNSVAPQIMATFQTMASVPDLSEATLDSWQKFFTTLGPAEIGPYIGTTSATFVACWNLFTPKACQLAQSCMDYIVIEVGSALGSALDDIVDLSSIPQLREAYTKLRRYRRHWTPRDRLQKVLERAQTDNVVMATQALTELKVFMSEADSRHFMVELATGDMFDPLVGRILSTLLSAASQDSEGAESLRLLAFECVSILGAVDPDRCEIGVNDSRMIVLHNFSDETESTLFATHLIRDLLVGAFRSTSDIRYQSHLAYSIQELLQFCDFTTALVSGRGSAPIRARNRWNSLPKHVLETVTPLLEARFTLQEQTFPEIVLPIYPYQTTYREWMQLWVTYLISRASGSTAKRIFGVFRLAVRNKDVVVAHHLLPHLVLNILISGDDDDTKAIRTEILAVLEDQVTAESSSTADKRLLSAQAVFTLLDHLNKWVRKIRQELVARKSESKRARMSSELQLLEHQLSRVDSILASIDQNLMARAALQCKAYARSLMNFEQQISTLLTRTPNSPELSAYYERLHEIYAHLDEPDGMEGVSTLILSPSLEHQIRQHESTGKWTSAQSCWEVRLQQSPDNVEFHLGLLRCLRNLGHYDTLRTHVRGALTRHPAWEPALAGFQVESACMVGAWDEVRLLVNHSAAMATAPIVMGRLLLAMQSRDSPAIDQALSHARTILGAPITAAGVNGYRRSYDAVLDLHLTHELEIIYQAMTNLPTSQNRRRAELSRLSHSLSARLDATLPTFRTREPVLSMRRTAFGLFATQTSQLSQEIGRSWLASAKIARKAGQWQTAYSAMLQAQQTGAPFPFMESSKLLKVTGEPLRALVELENSMKLHGLLEEVLDLTVELDEETKRMNAKAQLLRARWMSESDRFELNFVHKTFLSATEMHPDWESSNFYIGHYQDVCFKELPPADKLGRGVKMNMYTIRAYAKALKLGSKFVYQMVPRLLTIWLDLGEEASLNNTESFKKITEMVSRSFKEVPVYKWFTAFPQIVSRVGHTNTDVYRQLAKLIIRVLEEYPKQGLWLFASVVKSTKSDRSRRGRAILEKLQAAPTSSAELKTLIAQSISMTNELLALCDRPVDVERRPTLSLLKDFPNLARLQRCHLLIPLRESLTASLPPSSASEATHQPFPTEAPTFQEIFDEIEVMRSLAKPRKITIRGSNGQIYMFLGKPKDDLRKDARLMDFNTIINKLLKANSESRRRQLHIRTYGVVTLNEECGFIQWVPNTVPIRPVLVKAYDSRGVASWTGEMNEIFRKIKDANDKLAADAFRSKVLPKYPPIFHEWFIETFPEPSAWFASRVSYGRTAAVMSMVGFILGLGDRHCENILLDTNVGDVVHVDFNCLFEKGKTLETPERVPFRLTPNIVDGMGVTGVEGVFRIACEVTMQILRDNQDSLMSVLDAFIHDPLVEWEDEKRKLEQPNRRSSTNQVRASVDLQALAKHALSLIEKKLKGIYSTSKERTSHEKEVSTSNLVQILIQEASDMANLAKMYPGWCAWH